MDVTRGNRYLRSIRAAAEEHVPAIEQLEPRMMQSAAGWTHDVASSTTSPATTGAGGSTDYSSLQVTSAHRLISLDDFRADERFSRFDGRGYSVAVIDSGLDRDHPFFGGDVDRNNVSDRIIYSYDYADTNGDASDTDGHGSNVTSIIASSDAQFPGVAPSVNIIHLKVFSSVTSDRDTFRPVEQALRWVANNTSRYNIVSVNLSLGGNDIYNRPVQLQRLNIADELQLLANRSVLVFASSGNSYAEAGSIQGFNYPAADPNVIAVGAVYDRNIGRARYGDGVVARRTRPDVITPFSQRSTAIDQIFAPGAEIIGASHDGALVSMSGTSQAAPHVAGTAVLMQQIADKILGRRLRLEEFRTLLRQTGDVIRDGDDERDTVGHTGGEFRRLNVHRLASAIWDIAGAEIRASFDQRQLQSGVGTLAFGTTTGGTSVERTVTIENTGRSTLKLARLILPDGYSVVSGFGSRRIAPDTSTTFTVRLDGAAAGTFNGDIVVRSNDRDERDFVIKVTGAVRTVLTIADNGERNVVLTGVWHSGSGGNGGDHHATSNAGASAVFQFERLLPGTYRVAGYWLNESGFSSRARFRIHNNAGVDSTVVVDQSAHAGQAGWRDFGDFEVVDGRLTVTLTARSDGAVKADAIRLERIGQLQGAPLLHVSRGAIPVASDDVIEFGSTLSGNRQLRAFTLRNLGGSDLVIDPAMLIPQGFRVSSRFATTLRPGTSTVLDVELEAGAAGSFAGDVTILSSSRAGEHRINVAGVVTPYVRIIDNGEAGFETSGSWSPLPGGVGFRRDALAGNTAAAAVATWRFTRLIPGLYRAWATWPGGSEVLSERSASAVYTIDSGGSQVNISRSHQSGPTGEVLLATTWSPLTTVMMTGDSLTVTLTGETGLVLADAIRIERVGNLPR